MPSGGEVRKQHHFPTSHGCAKLITANYCKTESLRHLIKCARLVPQHLAPHLPFQFNLNCEHQYKLELSEGQRAGWSFPERTSKRSHVSIPTKHTGKNNNSNCASPWLHSHLFMHLFSLNTQCDCGMASIFLYTGKTRSSFLVFSQSTEQQQLWVSL